MAYWLSSLHVHIPGRKLEEAAGHGLKKGHVLAVLALFVEPSFISLPVSWRKRHLGKSGFVGHIVTHTRSDLFTKAEHDTVLCG